MTLSLTEEQVSAFRRDGMLVVEDVVPEALRRRIEAEYEERLDALCAGWGLRPRGDFFETLRAAHGAGHDWFTPLDISLPAGEILTDTPFHAGPAVFDLLTEPAILDVAEDLIGPELTSNPIQHVRVKPPMAEVAADEARPHVTVTAWHQDRGVAHPEADATDMVTVWMAMTDADEDNGCLLAQVTEADGQDMLPHCPVGGQSSIPRASLDRTRVRPLPVRAGGVVLLHPMTPHASLPNRTTDRCRWSFDLRYNRTGQPTGRSHFPSFVARSRAAPRTELRDWRAWRASWEAARASLAKAPHIPIHRWQADSPACA